MENEGRKVFSDDFVHHHVLSQDFERYLNFLKLDVRDYQVQGTGTGYHPWTIHHGEMEACWSVLAVIKGCYLGEGGNFK